MNTLTIMPVLAAIALSAVPAVAARTSTADEIIALDHAWGAAETRGDAAFVARLLAPDYRSVDSQGQSHDRSAILKSAQASGSDPTRAQRIAAWRVAHPTSPVVVIAGGTAILRWVDAKDPSRTLSSDIFVRHSGHWMAIYSQHTAAGS